MRLVFLSLFLPLFAADDSKWLRVKSENFEVLTTAGERRAKETLLEFERVSGFFEQSLQKPLKPDVPLRIILFKSEKEFLKYRAGEVAVAYYLPGPDADYIVLHNAGDSRIAIHEFVHLLMKHSSKTQLPTWLNEGIAELYSTMKQLGNKVQIGGLIDGHMYLFANEKPIPLAELLAADHDSALYNRKRHAGMFYAESWALTHMLQLSPEYKQSFGKFFQQIENGAASLTALEAATGKPAAKIQADLAAYMRGSSFFGVNFDAKLLGKLGAQVSAEAAPDNEVAVVRSALLATAGNHDEARTVLSEAAAKDPNDPALAVASGYRQWRDGKFSEAKTEFKRAFELGTENKRVLFDLARMSANSDPDLSVSALLRLTALGPATLETKMLLGEQLLRQKKFGAAHGALVDIARVTKPADAYRVSRIRAMALDSLHAPEEAMKMAQAAERFAVSGEEKEYAQRLVAYLKAKQDAAANKTNPGTMVLEAAVESTGGSGVSFIDEDRTDGPVLRRKYVDDSGKQVEEKIMLTKRSPNGDPMTEVRGKFVALECKGQQASVVLSITNGKTAAFLIKDPNQLVASNKGEGMAMDLTCGPQPPKEVSVWHDAAGVLWQIHFQ